MESKNSSNYSSTETTVNVPRSPTLQTNEIDIYIPVNFYKTTNPNKLHKNLNFIYLMKADKENPNDSIKNSMKINFVTCAINQLMEYRSIQIGMNEEEAKEIVNKHSHKTGTLIFQLKVPADCIATTTESKGSNKLFCWLNKNTKIKSRHIIAITAMSNDEYKNTIKFKFNVDDYWPKGYRFSPYDESFIHAAKNEVKRLKSTYFSTEKTKQINSAIEERNINKIEEAMTIRRFPLIDRFFGSKTTTSQDNIEKELDTFTIIPKFN